MTLSDRISVSAHSEYSGIQPVQEKKTTVRQPASCVSEKTVHCIALAALELVAVFFVAFLVVGVVAGLVYGAIPLTVWGAVEASIYLLAAGILFYEGIKLAGVRKQVMSEHPLAVERRENEAATMTFLELREKYTWKELLDPMYGASTVEEISLKLYLWLPFADQKQVEKEDLQKWVELELIDYKARELVLKVHNRSGGELVVIDTEDDLTDRQRLVAYCELKAAELNRKLYPES
ncbi:MAG: hypothetical protein KGJ02_07955 [Verrucomicrobiota bacterium]|nr:hypothetical protein [Verrucomicrobiota bacterium]